MENNNQSIFSARDTSSKTSKSEMNGNASKPESSTKLLTEFAAQQTLPAEFRYLSAELRLQIWEDRVAALKPQIISLEISPASVPTVYPEAAFKILGSGTLQVTSEPKFSVRNAVDCHLAHICFEARQVYLKTYKPLFGEEFSPTYANLEKDIIHFGSAHEICKLQAIARSVDPRKFRKIILEYDLEYSLPASSWSYGHQMVDHIVKVCLLFPRLKKLIIVPHPKSTMKKDCLDFFKRHKAQANRRRKQVIRLIKRDRKSAPITYGSWYNTWEEEECFLNVLLEAEFERKVRRFRQHWRAPTILFRQNFM
ncbi:hypothetical protein L207DRAFT_586164 [Hyaloscypha variabilis F]|uniref:2EXR domain-containing protein n=1 Tax=Hyaloscypha variabilis (strain UAMH 11265 / GT02V1 / F) TaxID=1149755 RepID=A0A2J6RD65_HYAVF|nr:hypothetical protein L207DRAFT_586164 [Hyaloscypha variabilis F]